MIDCFDGKVVAWQTFRHPDYALVDTMLNKAFNTLSNEETLAIKIKMIHIL